MRRSTAREQKVSTISRFSKRGLLTGGLVLGGAASAALLTELRHRRALAADPLNELLTTPLVGEPFDVVSIDGTLLHAEVFGGSGVGPTVVLVPGWTEQIAVWTLVVRGLVERGFRVASYDLRGQGLSGLPVDDDQRIERYGEDLDAVLAAVGAERSDVLVAGHSMGGMSIMAWAAAFDASSRVRAAALINTGAALLVESSALLPSSLPVALRRAVGIRLVLEGAPPPHISTPVSRAVTRYAAFGPTASPAQVALLERMDADCPPRVRRAAGATLGSLEVMAGVKRLTVPTLVVTGDMDRMTPPLLAQELVEALPQLADFVLLEQTGHMTPLERPDQLVEALVRLAAGVGLVGSADRARADANPTSVGANTE
jgi:pimeloyl-ACP methyl ester carboxylesterase